jgi:hypothetical protein
MVTSPHVIFDGLAAVRSFTKSQKNSHEIFVGISRLQVYGWFSRHLDTCVVDVRRRPVVLRGQYIAHPALL